MFIYLLLAVMLLLTEFLLETYRVKERRTVFIAVAFTLLCVLACFKDYSVGTDTEQFVKSYLYFSERGFSAVNFHEIYEPGYILYQVLLSRVCPNPRFLIVVSNLFINFAVLYFIKQISKDYFISVCIYVFTCQFLAGMCMMRQFLAISIGLLAFPLLLKKKYICYGLLILLSASFHYFALLYLVLIPIHIVKRLPKGWLIACLGVFALVYALTPQITMFVIKHVDNYNDYLIYLEKVGEGATLRIPPMLFVCIAVLLPVYLLERSKTRHYKTVFNYRGNNYEFMHLTYLFLICIVLLAGRFGLLTRVYYYFTPYLCLIPNMLHLEQESTWKDRANLLDYVVPKRQWLAYPGMLLIKPASDWKVYYACATLSIFGVSLLLGMGTYGTENYRFMSSF